MASVWRCEPGCPTASPRCAPTPPPALSHLGMLGFLGITEVDFVAADRLAMDRDAGLARAQEALDKLAA